MHKILIAIFAIALFVCAHGCVTAEDTQRAADVQREFETTKEDVSAQLAAGTITTEQATKMLADAFEKLRKDMGAVANDVKDRTSSWFDPQRIIEIILGGAITGLATHKAVNVTRDNARRARGEPVSPLGPQSGGSTGGHA